MTWRPWIIVALIMTAFVTNVALIFNEYIPAVTLDDELRKVNEILRTMDYRANNRRSNFRDMGMDDDLADATAKNIERLQRQKAKWLKLLADKDAGVETVFCPSERLPQPYAALEYLVYTENEVRRVKDPVTFTRFEAQPWYADSLVEGIYNTFERSERRMGEATLMGVSALLIQREAAALDGVSPFSTGIIGSWGFSRLERQEPRVRQMAIEYFSVMHYLTELATAQQGICP